MTSAMAERAVVFSIRGVDTLGIIHPGVAGVGVLIVVGGPQYRIGSHRQFLLLARALAAHGIPAMRFDSRGMGDSTDGGEASFLNVDEDIEAAIGAFLTHAKSVKRIVIWGLCDAASAALMYAHQDPRVLALVLVNPWVRAPDTQARTFLRHYYSRRLRSPEFWRKVLGLRLDVAAALGDVKNFIATAARATPGTGPARAAGATPPVRMEANYIDVMRNGLAAFDGPILLIMSGDDLTAAEFGDLLDLDPRWRALGVDKLSQRLDLVAANHTFSTAEWKRTVADATADFVKQLTSG